MVVKSAKFNIGQAVRHRHHDFGGLVVDVDPVFCEDEARLEGLPPGQRPDRDQPFYRVFVDCEGVESTAYVSEENLVADTSVLVDDGGAGALDEASILHGLVH
ncbi:heat shock protein HspQ [Acuticoccus sp. I52.16.1]|uniref:heat shock protein HspQ n=1 Tax=Acuticoccus sp. I52.16.1 TaxID=2928472 RepID=UPI001FCF98A3|nr:heat shock protein HspQ [Acuticoccus sp. I52.16.1]UOM35333.1 heat shock protein HspQ [Acuticoccus sp. I52.16.1]